MACPSRLVFSDLVALLPDSRLGVLAGLASMPPGQRTAIRLSIVLNLGSFAWNVLVGIFGLGIFAWELSLENFRLGSFLRETGHPKAGGTAGCNCGAAMGVGHPPVL